MTSAIEPINVPITDLSEEAQGRVEALETEADIVFGLRHQLAKFYSRNKAYLAQYDDVGDVVGRSSLEGMQQRVSEGGDILELINWQAVDARAAGVYPELAQENPAFAVEMHRDQVKRECELALNTHRQLVEHLGTWVGLPKEETDATEIQRYYHMRWGELSDAASTVESLLETRALIAQKLQVLQNGINRAGSTATRVAMIRKYDSDLKANAEEMQLLVEQSPEAYLYVKVKAIRDMKQTYDEGGRIVKMPFVVRKENETLDFIKNGQPVMIVGELGTGKTEFAINLSRTILSKKHVARWEAAHPSPVARWEMKNPAPEGKAQFELWMSERAAYYESLPLSADTKQHLEAWEAQNPLSDEAIEYAQWQLARQRAQEELAHHTQQWEALREKERQPLFLGGHKSTEVEEMIGARTISRKEPISPEEQMRIINGQWEDYKQVRIAELTEGKKPRFNAVEDAEQFLESHEWDVFSGVYRAALASPVEAQIVLGPFLQAMEEGRPYIEDETNAIPHHLQIIKNDLLLRKPGDWVKPPIAGARAFQVKEGFAYLSTGNYRPEDGKLYVGRQQLDAAYLSRFGIIFYDYLPMQLTSETDDLSPEEMRVFRAQNELYQMLVVRLLEADLTAYLPDGTLGPKGKLFELAKCARHIQDIFAGQDTQTKGQGERGDVAFKDILQENVLSIRHMLAVLDAWKRDGFQYSLDVYVYMKYVARSAARPLEMKNLYQFLQTEGAFFPESEGWPGPEDEAGILNGLISVNGQKISINELLYGEADHTMMHRFTLQQAATGRMYSLIDVVSELYGPPPSRVTVPQWYAEGGFTRPPAEPEEDLAAKMEKERQIAHMVGQVTERAEVFESLGEQEFDEGDREKAFELLQFAGRPPRDAEIAELLYVGGVDWLGSDDAFKAHRGISAIVQSGIAPRDTETAMTIYQKSEAMLSDSKTQANAEKYIAYTGVTREMYQDWLAKSEKKKKKK